MRKTASLIACLSVSLFMTSASYGLITEWNCAADGDGAIDTVGDLVWTDLGLENGISAYELSMDAVQAWGPAHMEGDFTTDTPTDPIVYLMEDVDNQTGFTWTGYEFKVFMDKTFSIVTAFAPYHWSYTISPIVANQPWPHNPGVYGYMGVISFTADPGYEINPGDIGTFGAKLRFDGSVSFSTEQMPIPEPMTMVLLGLGGLVAFRKK